MSTSSDIIKIIQKESKGKHGIFCLNCLLMHSTFKELNEFIEKNNLQYSKVTKTKAGYLKELAVLYYNVYHKMDEIRKLYKNSSDLMGDMLLKDEKIKEHLSEFDFISKQELIDVFADYCADLGISVFPTKKIVEYSLDIYLTKKTPLLRTEAVFIRTGEEMDISNYEETLNLIEKSSKIAMWIVFVTTPAGVYKIGLDRLIEDMKRLNVWLYIVDPLHKKISGITKGKKSKDYDVDLSQEYIQKLPREPVRAPSQVVKISKYKFSESGSYKPKSFFMFELLPEEDFDKVLVIPNEKHKYRDIFRNLLLIDKTSGLLILSYKSEEESVDDDLISGFLTAMDGFVSELGGSTNLREVAYKGFYIQAGYGEYIKVALFLSKQADRILKERLAYFVKQFEENYEEQINLFKESGNLSYFKNKEIIEKAKEILDI